MANFVLPPYMALPPIYDELLNKKGEITNNWQNYINSITRITGLVIVNDWLVNPITHKRVVSVGTLVAPWMSEDRRNSLDNSWNGMVIYNLDTNRMNFRENGAWVTFTPIAA